MNTINIVFPHQLFKENPLIEKEGEFYLVEEPLYFQYFKFHVQKQFYANQMTPIFYIPMFCFMPNAFGNCYFIILQFLPFQSLSIIILKSFKPAFLIYTDLFHFCSY